MGAKYINASIKYFENYTGDFASIRASARQARKSSGAIDRRWPAQQRGPPRCLLSWTLNGGC